MATDLHGEIAALERVLFRLASVDDARLMDVLEGLLPQLLRLFPSSTASPLEAQLKDKILEVIAHIKTRLHAIAAPRLPLPALAEIITEGREQPSRSPFVANFAFLFLEMGFMAETHAGRVQVLGRVATALDRAGTAQQETFFRLLLRSLPVPEATEILPATSSLSAEIVLEFLLDVVLFQSGNAADAGSAFGLSLPRIHRLERTKVTVMSREELYACQLHVLQFVKALGASQPMSVLHYVAGAASFHHAIKAFSDDQLHRIVREDSSVLANASACRDVMSLIMSSQVATQGRALEGRDAIVLGNRMRLSDPGILAATAVLQASKAATNVMPLMLQVICQLIFADEPSRPQNVAQRVKIAGARLCEWAFHHCDDQVLVQLLGPVLLPTLLRSLMDPNADLDASNASFWREYRVHLYESISVIASRFPGLVMNTERAFQVLLVRCLIEEQSRSGVNALKAFGALRVAFESLDCSGAVLTKIRSELVGLLQGSKLYDTTYYERVRVTVAEWALTVLRKSEQHAEATKLRFALFKLCGDSDEGVAQVAMKALYADPLPPLKDVVSTLQSLSGLENGTCNLQRAMSIRQAQQCLNFLLAVMMTDERSAEDTNDDKRREELIRFFVETLLQTNLSTLSSPSDFSPLCNNVGAQIICLRRAYGEAVDLHLRGQSSQIIDVMLHIRDRQALQRLAILLRWSLPSDPASVGALIEPSLSKLKSPTTACSDFCASAYCIGSVLRFAENVLYPTQHSTAIHLCETLLAQLVSSVQATAQVVVHFSMLPRGEEALRELFDRLRSCLDAVGLSGNLNGLFGAVNPPPELFEKLHTDITTELSNIVRWKLDAVSGDGSVKQKLSMIRVIALEAIARITTSNSHMPSPSIESTITSVLNLGNQQDTELQFSIGLTLVAIGTSHSTKYASIARQLVDRVVRDYAVSRHATLRRSATVWLLCLCAAGLANSSHGEWNRLFATDDFAKILVQVHEHFVTMLNDSDPVATECAVKGLAYLRLKAPSKDLGDQFSDSLFRRLRCFRAFTPLSGTNNSRGSDDDDDSEERNAARPTNSTLTTDGETVDNAAYREVSNVAADIGDPDLMYSLLYLSTINPIWLALLTAAEKEAVSDNLFSFSIVDRTFRKDIIANASQQWMSEAFIHRKKLIPWLFLLKNHSNPKVADVMNILWSFAWGEVVVSSSQEKSLLVQQWDVIFQFLLTKLENSRNFKYREACCIALVELLNGAEAENIEASFVRLWKLTARSVDDIMEAVSVAGLKLFKALGEISLRIAVKHEQCRRDLLDYLISDGMVSKNVVCRALCIDLLLRLVKDIDPCAIQDRMAALILKLLEYLSSLEMPELQYAQFHFDKKDQLERLRVSLSQSGPIGQLLDQCLLKLKALATSDGVVSTRIVDEVARGIANLLKFGVGLNTRVGTANFAATLATELPYELRKSNGAEVILTRALMPYVNDRSAAENDLYGDESARYESSGGGVSDAVVLQSYLRAAAYLCPLVDASTVKKYVRSSVFAVHRRHKDEKSKDDCLEETPEDADGFAHTDTYISRFLMVSAMATNELVAKCPPIADASTMVNPDERNDWYTADVFPAAYLGQFASSPALRAVWTAVLEELPPRIKYADSALEATLLVLGRWVRHPSWNTRAQGVTALESLFSPQSAYRSKIASRQTDQIWTELLGAVPRRLWKGKGILLKALVAIASVRENERDALMQLFLQESDRAWKNLDLEYLESALQSISCLAKAMPADEQSQLLRLRTFDSVRSRLETWRTAASEPEFGEAALPPMMIKVGFETLGAVFPDSAASPDATQRVAEILQWLDGCATQPALHVWSVRSSIFTATERLVRSAPPGVFVSRHPINRLVDRCCGDLGVGDGKYWMVRVAAAQVLAALTSRHAEPAVGLQLAAHRERLASAVSVLRGSQEPREQHAALEILGHLARVAGA